MRHALIRCAVCFCTAAFFALSLSSALPAAAADRTGGTDRAQAEAVWGIPEIDGVKENLWNRAEKNPVVKVDTEVIPSETQVTGEFSLLWDGEFLYVGVTVEKHGSPVVSAFSGEDNDSVEVALTDLGLFEGVNNVSDAHNPDAGGFRVGCDGAVSGFGGYFSLTETNFRAAASVLSEDSYFVEMAIPFLHLVPQDGSVLSLEVQINAAEKETGRVGLVTWAAQPCLGWRDSAVHGAVTLTGRVEFEHIPSANTGDGNTFAVLSALTAGGVWLRLRKKRRIFA